MEKIMEGGDIQRKFFACAVNMGTESSPDFQTVGYKIESSALELNPDIETITDIHGDTYTTLNKFELSQTFEPHRLHTGNELGEKLIELFRANNLAAFSQFQCILIYGFLGTPGNYPADLYDECSIIPSSLGGDAYAEMPFTVNFGGAVTNGTADRLKGQALFTPD